MVCDSCVVSLEACCGYMGRLKPITMGGILTEDDVDAAIARWGPPGLDPARVKKSALEIREKWEELQGSTDLLTICTTADLYYRFYPTLPVSMEPVPDHFDG